MQSIRWTWSYIRNNKIRLFFGLLLALVVSALSMANPYLAGKIVDDVMYGQNKSLIVANVSFDDRFDHSKDIYLVMDISLCLKSCPKASFLK